MAIVKNFGDFNPKKGTAVREADKEAPKGGNQDANARKAIADLTAAETEIQKISRERIKLAKDWAAGSDEERPDLLDQLRKIQLDIKKLQQIANKAEKEFNVASGVEVLESEDPAPGEVIEEKPIEQAPAPVTPAVTPVVTAPPVTEGAVKEEEEEEEEKEEEQPTAIQESSDDHLVFTRK